VSKAAASEDEEVLSDEDDMESEDENLDLAMPTADMPDKDVEMKTDVDGMVICMCCKFSAAPYSKLRFSSACFH